MIATSGAAAAKLDPEVNSSVGVGARAARRHTRSPTVLLHTPRTPQCLPGRNSARSLRTLAESADTESIDC